MTDQEKLSDVVRDLGITATVTHGCADEDQIRFDRERDAMRHKEGSQERRSALVWARSAFAWTVRLDYQGRSMTIAYWTGPGCVEKSARKTSRDPATVPKRPTAADVLYCIASDARGADQTFEDWCSDFGTDTDSRYAYETWQECAAMAPRLLRFLGDKATLTRIQDSEH